MHSAIEHFVNMALYKCCILLLLLLKLIMIPVCPRLLNMITDVVLLRFWARASEDLSAIEVIVLLLLLDD